MAKIGIIGTSHSQGVQPYTNGLSQEEIKEYWHTPNNKFTKPLEVHFKKYMPEHEFYNVASSGRGSERYLGSIIYLKKEFNIDVLLMELCADRTSNTYYKWEERYAEWNIKFRDKPNIVNEFIKEYYQLHGNYISSINSLFSNRMMGILKDVPENKLNTWRDIQSIIFQQSEAVRANGIKDMQQSIDLCNMLNIKVTTWDFRDSAINIFEKHQPLAFNEWMLTKNLQECYCDGWHADDVALDLGAKEYFKPIISKLLNN